MKPLSLSLPARLTQLPDVLRFADDSAQALQAHRDAALKLRVIVEELFLNSATHGGGEELVELTVAMEAGNLVLVYEDSGPPFNPLAQDVTEVLGGDIERRPVGKLGLVLIQQLAGATQYQRCGDRNRLRIALT